MQTTTLMLILIAMAATAFYFGRERSLVLAPGPKKTLSLHSLPGYYGYYTAIWAFLPALALLLLWIMIEPKVVVALVVKGLPDAQRSLSPGEINLLVNTPLGGPSFYDEHALRRAAIARRVPMLTTLSAARAAVEGIARMRENVLTVRPLQARA